MRRWHRVNMMSLPGPDGVMTTCESMQQWCLKQTVQTTLMKRPPLTPPLSPTHTCIPDCTLRPLPLVDPNPNTHISLGNPWLHFPCPHTADTLRQSKHCGTGEQGIAWVHTDSVTTFPCARLTTDTALHPPPSTPPPPIHTAYTQTHSRRPGHTLKHRSYCGTGKQGIEWGTHTA
jgi:hypothetical protein